MKANLNMEKNQSKQPKNEILKMAEQYIRDGWNIVPIPVKSKSPVIKWRKYQKERATENDLKKWFKNGNGNIGIITGEISGLLVVDLDKGCDSKDIDLPPTMIVETGGGGYHYYYKIPKGVKLASCAGFKEKIDIRAEGGLVVAPPSVHKSGKLYRWAIEHPSYNFKLVECPTRLIKKLNQRRNAPRDWQSITGGVEKGVRNVSTASYIGKLLTHLPEEDWESIGWTSLEAWNLRNKPSLAERELRAVFDSIARAEATKREVRVKFPNDRKAGIDKIAKFLIEKYNLKTIAGVKSEDIYIYKDGIYVLEGKSTLESEIEQMLAELSTTHYVNEIIDKVKRLTFVDRKSFENEDKNLICLNNGILDLKNPKLLPHTPDYVFLSKIPINYNPKANCPKIRRFFSTTLHKEDIHIIQEWFGYTLWRGYPIKKALIPLGERDTGKTTFENLLGRFIGEENFSVVSLQKICDDRFASASLYGKLSNIYDDLSFKDLRDPGKFKIATGSGYLDGEEKFKDRFKFKNYAKLTFATNQIPQVKYDDDAYYSRWIVIPFDNIFDDNNPKTDKQLFEKITTDEELSGLLNWALEGLRRLLRNNRFSYNRTLDQVKDIMQRSGSTLAAFIQDEIIRKDGNFIPKDDFFKAYSEYTQKKGIWRISKEKIGRDLPKFASYIIDGKGTVTVEEKRKRVRGWWNLAFKNGNKFKKENDETPIKKLYLA